MCPGVGLRRWLRRLGSGPEAGARAARSELAEHWALERRAAGA